MDISGIITPPPAPKDPIPLERLTEQVTYMRGGGHDECPGHIRYRTYSVMEKGESRAKLIENHYLDDYNR